MILISLAELFQFRDGLLKIEGMYVICKHSNLLELFYCIDSQTKLTSGTIYMHVQQLIYSRCIADKIQKLFTEIKFTEKCVNERMNEEASYNYVIFGLHGRR